MTWGDDLYSRVVAWMKIILPLAALGLLSTLFLISRTVDPTQQAILEEIDLEQRAHEQGVTNPSFAGVTSGGDEVRFQATRARPDLNNPERLIADEVMASIRLHQGAVIDITSDHADMHQSKFTVSMEGSVTLQTSNGYLIHTDRIETRYDTLFVETPGAVEASGPPGNITAGKMRLTSDEASGQAEILFTDGVKLIYKPKHPKD